MKLSNVILGLSLCASVAHAGTFSLEEDTYKIIESSLVQGSEEYCSECVYVELVGFNNQTAQKALCSVFGNKKAIGSAIAIADAASSELTNFSIDCDFHRIIEKNETIAQNDPVKVGTAAISSETIQMSKINKKASLEYEALKKKIELEGYTKEDFREDLGKVGDTAKKKIDEGKEFISGAFSGLKKKIAGDNPEAEEQPKE